MLVSCSSVETQQTVQPVAGGGGFSTGGQASQPAEPGLSSSAADLARVSASGTEERRAQPVIYRGNDQQVKMPPVSKPMKLIGDDVSLNFEQAPLSEVMHAILGDILKLDYVVDHPVKGEVTLRTRTPVPREQLLGVLESLLNANDILMIRGEDNRYLITGSQQATRLAPGVSNPRSTGAGFSTMVVPLRYISAANMAEILRPVADESAFVRIDNTRNLLMLAGTRAQLDGWLEMVSTFDIDLLKGMSVGLFPLENSSVDEISDALTGLLGGAAGIPGGNVSDLAHLVRVIPVKRLNSLLVVTPRAHYLDRIGTWIERLDTRPDSNFEKRLFVYQVQNTTASRLAQLLTNIYSGGSGRERRGESSGVSAGFIQSPFGAGDTGGVAPGMNQETIGDPMEEGAELALPTDGGSQMFASSVGGQGAGSGSELGDVRVVADDENNALMVYATGKQYKIITAALERLDIVATQVLIEASILEVTLNDDLRYGLEWTFKNSVGDDYDGLGTLARSAGGPAASVPGFSYTVTNSVGDISAVLNALSEESLLNVISTPSVMVLDNHTAYIHVGDQVPIKKGEAITDGGTSVEQFEYRDTGVKLTVTPSVNAGGLVTMAVAQSVTDVGTIDDATGQRRFLERNIVSRVAVRSNESVVLGGLIRENASSGSSGVPILHKIPVVGALFGTVQESDTRTELLVIITPRALFNETELREVSREMRLQIRNMELIETPPL